MRLLGVMLHLGGSVLGVGLADRRRPGAAFLSVGARKISRPLLGSRPTIPRRVRLN